MLSDSNAAEFIKKMVLHTIKRPLVYLILGLIFLCLSYIDDIFQITKWTNFFVISNEIGKIVIYLAVLSFLLNLFVYVCNYFQQKYEDKQHFTALIFSSLITGARIIFVLTLINVIISTVVLDSYYLAVANNIINVIMIGSIGWVAIQILYTAEAGFYHYMVGITQTDSLRVKALYTKMRIIRNITTVVIVILTIAAILMSFSSVRNIGISLLASAGFLTAIIGLSAQKALFSVFSGLQIAISQPIKIGDVVVIEGNSGIIEEITFTYVTLKLGDRKRLLVPINYFIDKPFENWTREGESLRSSFIIHVDYLLPIEPLREELTKILDQSSYWDKMASKLQVADVTPKSVEIRVQVSAANADDLADLRAEVKEKLLNYIREHHPEHFPKMRLHNGDED